MASYLIACHEACPSGLKGCLIDVIRSKLEFQVKECSDAVADGCRDAFVVYASSGQLFSLAEKAAIKKVDQAGQCRDFEAQTASLFGPKPLTIAEQHYCMGFAIDNIKMKSLDIDPKLAGDLTLDICRSAGLIDTIPLHDESELAKLDKIWCRDLSLLHILNPPLDAIASYFGEAVALYFAFLTMYTKFLAFLTMTSIVKSLISVSMDATLTCDLIFLLLNVLLTSLFIELWKRKSNSLSVKWGTFGKMRHKLARINFKPDPSGCDYWRTCMAVATKSMPVILVCLVLALIAMLLSFFVDNVALQSYLLVCDSLPPMLSSVLYVSTYLPAMVYSLLIIVVNWLYHKLAHRLTEAEHHRTQAQFEKHVVTKLVLFESVNTFMALFYIAFYLMDVSMLHQQLLIMMAVQQLVNQLVETILPVCLRWSVSKKLVNKLRFKVVPTLPNAKPDSAASTLSRIPYDSTYEDFMELWLQFGHVVLFSVTNIHWQVCLLALVNNLVELRLDAIKMCRICRKPAVFETGRVDAKCCRDIGAWYEAFTFTAWCAVMTNSALLAIAWCPRDHCSWTCTVSFVFIEHCLLLLCYLVDRCIPDQTEKTKVVQDQYQHAKSE